MTYVVLVTLLILIQYLIFMMQAGAARGKSGLKAPAVTGNEVYERAARVQINTLEQMAITLPAVIFLYDLVLRDGGADRPTIQHVLNTLQKRAYFYSGYVAVSLVYVFIRFFILYSPGGYLNASYGSWVERIIFLPGHIFSFIKLS